MKQFSLTQMQVGNRLGVAEETVRELRRELLVEGEDWVKQGNKVLLSEFAELKLWWGLNVAKPTGEQLQKNARTEAGMTPVGASRNFRVIRCLVNPHYVLAQAEEEVKAVEIRVRDNRLLLPGMVLECVKEPSGWVCPRVPRRKGVW